MELSQWNPIINWQRFFLPPIVNSLHYRDVISCLRPFQEYSTIMLFLSVALNPKSLIYRNNNKKVSHTYWYKGYRHVMNRATLLYSTLLYSTLFQMTSFLLVQYIFNCISERSNFKFTYLGVQWKLSKSNIINNYYL